MSANAMQALIDRARQAGHHLLPSLWSELLLRDADSAEHEMAAEPDMLDALREAEATLTMYSESGLHVPNTLAQVRAAIAKAEGRDRIAEIEAEDE